jgi:uncharacterized membrane protein
MSDEVPRSGPRVESFGTGRLEAFSDGVLAIAITLLVLELALPESDTALKSVLDAWPSFLAYIISFLTIGAAWLAHSAITDRLTRSDAVLLRLNLLLLLAITFLPFPTSLVAEAMLDTEGERVFVTMYGVTLLAIRVFLFIVDEYARREHLYAEDSEGTESRRQRKELLPILVAYGIAIVIGLFLPGSPWPSTARSASFSSYRSDRSDDFSSGARASRCDRAPCREGAMRSGTAARRQT